jgi:sulfopyruvate decarboxylase TPP-binding subunit
MKRESVAAVITGLKQAGINFVSMLPDSDFTNAQKTVMADKGFTCVPVSNEAIAFGVCAEAGWEVKTGSSHYKRWHHGQCIPV